MAHLTTLPLRLLYYAAAFVSVILRQPTAARQDAFDRVEREIMDYLAALPHRVGKD